MTDTPTLALGGTLICLAGCILGRVTSPGPGGVPSDSARRRIKEKLSKSCTSKADVKGGEMGELDVRRMCQIAVGGPTDHAGEVVIMPISDFDLNCTIFGSVTGVLPRTVQKSKVAVEMFWSQSAIDRVHAMYSLVPPPPSYKSSLVTFMKEECNFNMEHADGSFLDHLKFCHDYSCRHYPSQSPVPLLLHSIMGVGTNFFPMERELIPKLQSLITPAEFTQVAAFPSLLRLTLGSPILKDLANNVHRLDALKSVRFHRVIDNAPMTLSADEFWVQMNYQVIHMLDFLPCASWRSQMDDNFLCAFNSLYGTMAKAGKLVAKIDFDLESGEKGADGLPVTLGSTIRSLAPNFILAKLAEKALKKFSNAIGHSLEYEIVWGEYTPPKLA